VTALTARRVRYGVGARSICQPDPLAGYKAVVPPPLFYQLSPSLSPSLFILAMSRASGLGRALLSPPSPPLLQARGPTERYDAASQKNAPPRDCWL
jgi:hypothetical protein